MCGDVDDFDDFDGNFWAGCEALADIWLRSELNTLASNTLFDSSCIDDASGCC